MIERVDDPAGLGFHAAFLLKQKELLRIVDANAFPFNYYEHIPIRGETNFDKNCLRHGVVFSIYSAYLQVRDIAGVDYANTLLK